MHERVQVMINLFRHATAKGWSYNTPEQRKGIVHLLVIISQLEPYTTRLKNHSHHVQRKIQFTFLLSKQSQIKRNVHFFSFSYFCFWSSFSLVYIRFISSPGILYHNHHITVNPAEFTGTLLWLNYFCSNLSVSDYIYIPANTEKAQCMATIRSFNWFLVVL